MALKNAAVQQATASIREVESLRADNAAVTIRNTQLLIGLRIVEENNAQLRGLRYENQSELESLRARLERLVVSNKWLRDGRAERAERCRALEQASATDKQTIEALKHMFFEKNAELNQLQDLNRTFCRDVGKKI